MIQLTNVNGKKFWITVRQIVCLEPEVKGTRLWFNYSMSRWAKEPMAEIIKKINALEIET